MEPDAKTSTWKPPKGWTLKVIPGHTINGNGFQGDRGGAMPDGQIEVAHFFADEPFVHKPNDGTSANASIEARKAALAGKPIEGWSPNCILLPIENGWVPDQYVLTKDDDETVGAVKPHETSLA